MKKVIVLCTGNSCRSQMAEGYLKQYAKNKAAISSAGVEAHGLNPNAVKVMAEDGVDISMQLSSTMNEYLNEEFDYIITVCDNAAENCPAFPGSGKRLHQSFPDPAGATGTEEEVMRAYRNTRDLLKLWCKAFVNEHLD